MGIDRNPEPMIRALSDEDDQCRFWVLTGLGCLLAEPAIVLPAVEGQLSDTKFGNRQIALHTLGAYCELANQYVESVADCLRDKNQFVRETVQLIHMIALKYDADTPGDAELDALLELRNTDDFSLKLDVSKAIRSLAVHTAPFRDTIATWLRDFPSSIHAQG